MLIAARDNFQCGARCHVESDTVVGCVLSLVLARCRIVFYKNYLSFLLCLLFVCVAFAIPSLLILSF